MPDESASGSVATTIDTTQTATVPTAGPSLTGAAPLGAPAAPAGDWRAGLPDEVRQDPLLARVPDLPTLARNYLEAQRTIRSTQRTAPLPGPTGQLTPEQIAQWRKEELPKLQQAGVLEGPPAAPEGYQLQDPQTAVGDPAWGQTKSSFTAAAHALGLSPRQAQGLVDWYGREQEGRLAQLETLYDEGFKALEQVYGPTTRARVARANQVLTNHDVTGNVRKILQAAHLDNNPDLIRLLVSIGDRMYEHRAIEFTADGRGPTAEDVNRQIDELLKDRQGPFHNPMHPDHQAARKQYQALFQQLEMLRPTRARWPQGPS
jgi:hypothetical protein